MGKLLNLHFLPHARGPRAEPYKNESFPPSYAVLTWTRTRHRLLPPPSPADWRTRGLEQPSASACRSRAPGRGLLWGRPRVGCAALCHRDAARGGGRLAGGRRWARPPCKGAGGPRQPTGGAAAGAARARSGGALPRCWPCWTASAAGVSLSPAAASWAFTTSVRPPVCRSTPRTSSATPGTSTAPRPGRWPALCSSEAALWVGAEWSGAERSGRGRQAGCGRGRRGRRHGCSSGGRGGRAPFLPGWPCPSGSPRLCRGRGGAGLRSRAAVWQWQLCGERPSRPGPRLETAQGAFLGNESVRAPVTFALEFQLALPCCP